MHLQNEIRKLQASQQPSGDVMIQFKNRITDLERQLAVSKNNEIYDENMSLRQTVDDLIVKNEQLSKQIQDQDRIIKSKQQTEAGQINDAEMTRQRDYYRDELERLRNEITKSSNTFKVHDNQSKLQKVYCYILKTLQTSHRRTQS